MMSSENTLSEQPICPSIGFLPAGNYDSAEAACGAAEVTCRGLVDPLASTRRNNASKLPSSTHLDVEQPHQLGQQPGSPVNSCSAMTRIPAAEGPQRAQEMVAGVEKMCSQCFATKTPMWRNDSNGNKTLCNACGVRLQRQVNKAKQQAAATSEPPTSLIAGKLPRSRTSPAKLSRADLGRSCSQDSLGSFGPPLSGSRTLTLVHGPEGESYLAPAVPAPAVKRKQGDVTAPPPMQEDDRKRLCNDSISWQSGPGTSSSVPAELLVPAMPSWRRVPNCIVCLDRGLGGSSLPSSLLQVFQASGVKAATCTIPQTPLEPFYDASLQGWLWNSPAGWSLLLATQELCDCFRGLLSSWRLRRTHSALPASFSDPAPSSMTNSHPGARATAAFDTGPNSAFVAGPDDLAFIKSLNEHVQKNVEVQDAAEGGSIGAKALNAPLTQHAMERLVHAFEMFARDRPQKLNKSLVVAFCEKTSWCPHRAIGLLVFDHWVNSILPRRGGEASQSRSGASPGASPCLQLARSFSATSSAAGVLGAALEPTHGDLDGMSTSRQQHASSETSDQTQSLGVFSGDAALLPQTLVAAQASPQLPLQIPMPQGIVKVSTPPQPPFPPHSVFQSHASLAAQWSSSPVAPSALSVPTLENHNPEDEWEPLDPQTLAKIADPNQPRLSPGEEYSDQTTSLMDANQSPTPRGRDDSGALVTRQDGTRSGGAPAPMFRAHTPNLRRVASLAKATDMIRSQSPGTPTSHVIGPLRLLTKHASIEQPSYGKPLYSEYGAVGTFDPRELAAMEHDNNLFFTDVLKFS